MKKRLIAACLGLALGVFLYVVAEKKYEYMGNKYNNNIVDRLCWGQDVYTFEGNGLCIEYIASHCAMPYCMADISLIHDWAAIDISLQIESTDYQSRFNFFRVVYPDDEEK